MSHLIKNAYFMILFHIKGKRPLTKFLRKLERNVKVYSNEKEKRKEKRENEGG